MSLDATTNKASAPGRKTVIEVRDRNPYGEDFDASTLDEGGKSVTYIPGYSDARERFEIAVAKGERPTPLKHRMQWARAETPSGEPDGKKVSDWKRKRYAIAKFDEMKALGYDVSGFTRGTGGEVRLHEHVLMIAPKEIAAARYAKNQEAIADQFANRMADRGVSQDSPAAVFDIESIGGKKVAK